MGETNVSFSTQRGIRLAAVLHLPAKASESSPVPAVLLCQGLSGVKHLVLPEIAERLGEHGFGSLRFDYTGYGDSEGAAGWIDPRARVDDALHAFAWLAAQKSVDHGRIGVYGHSYGGPVAVCVASRERRARAVVSVSGPGDGEAMLRSLRASWEWIAFRHRLDEERTKVATSGSATLVDIGEIFPFSPAFKAAYEKLKDASGGSSAMAEGKGVGFSRFWLATVDAILDFHPEDAARRLRGCPLLLVHGSDDDVAPIETAVPVYDNAPGPKRWEIIPGAGHNDLDAGSGLGRAVDLAAGFATHLQPCAISRDCS